MCTYSSSCATMPNNVQCLSWLCAMHDPAWPDALGPSPLTHGHNTRRGHLHPVRGTPTVAFAGHAFSFISDIWIGNDGRGIKQGNPLTQGQTAGNSILVGNTNMHLHENQTDSTIANNVISLVQNICQNSKHIFYKTRTRMLALVGQYSKQRA